MKPFAIADLFCGAGGTSAGAVEAIRALGYQPVLTAINHWDVAIATHTANHPEARHLCTSLDNIDPKKLFKEGELQVLWASPECTHHSVARGGKPINDQSRATAWCVVRWAEALRPNVILVENVPEFESWGAIGSNGRPLKTKRGATFLAWVNALESLGYSVDWRVLCAADYGDPTTRRRLFVQAVRGRRKVVWPDPTHAPTGESDLFGSRKPWVAARQIIDWSVPGQSIYERKRPLSPKTMRRIMAGLEKFGLKPFLTPGYGERQTQTPRTHGVDTPVPTVAAQGHIHLAEPFIMSAGGPECGARPVSEPVGTVLTRDHRALVQPFIIPQQSNPTPKSVEEPLSTVVAEGSGPKLVQPFLIAMEHGGSVDSVEKPLRTVTCAKGGAIAVAQPFLVPQHSSNGPRSVDDPAPTVTTTSRGVGLAQPYIVRLQHNNEPNSVEKPLGTVLANGQHFGLAQPVLVKVAGADDRPARSVDQPLPTVTAGGVQHGIAQPFLIHTAHGGDARRPRSVAEPMPVVAGNRGDMALCEPSLLPQQSGGALRPVSQPAPTVSTDGAVGLVEPFLVEYYGNGNAESVDTPLNTVTTKDRHALVRPVVVINGEQYLLDIRFRMLQPHELAAAQGFRRDYKFTGTKSDQVKQIGNAVPRRLARALCLAALSQQSNVADLLTGEEAA